MTDTQTSICHRDAITPIITESALFKHLITTFGWSKTTQNEYIHALVKTITQKTDWRLDKIKHLNQRYSLHLEHEHRGIVLDAGCGAGSLTIAAHLSGYHIVGVELAPPCFELAQQLASAAGIPEYEISSLLVRHDLADLPFPPDHFSLITSHQVIEHVSDPTIVLREFYRCLQPGGLLWLDAPDYRFCFEPHYRIPWLPFLDKAIASTWLEVFEKTTPGLDNFNYVSLPYILEILKSFEMEIITAKTTTPIEQQPIELKNLIGNSEDYENITLDRAQLRELATKARNSGYIPAPTSLLILARKPMTSS